MNKQLFAFLLALIASISIVSAQKVLVGNVYYQLSSNDQTAGVCRQAGDSASNYPGLTTLNIPAVITYEGIRYTVTRIESRAFSNHATLSTVRLPNSLQEIGDRTFQYCPLLTSITLPNNVQQIGEFAFYGCSGMTSIRIPNYVQCIERYCFAECTGLRSVLLPANLIEIKDNAFFSCTSLSSVTFPTNLVIIQREAFRGCTGLQVLNIPSKVEYIGTRAFEGCTGLSTVRLPNSLVDVGQSAFEGCTGLTKPVYSSRIFVYMPSSYSGYYVIPNGIEVINEGAFAGCKGLTNIKIPSSVWYIDEEVFEECTSLPVVEGIRYADSYMVGVEDKMRTTYVVRPGTRWIAEEAFERLNNLTTVELPEELSTIGEEAFLQCRNLGEIFNNARVPQEITDDVFGGVEEWIEGELYGPVDKSTCVLYVPYESVDLYKSAPVWSDFAHIEPIMIPDGINELQSPNKPCTKELRDGVMYLKYEGRMYDVRGNELKK